MKISQINFYHLKQRIVTVGCNDDNLDDFGRIELFNIAEDEQLIGCKLDQDDRDDYFLGVTWIKMKVLTN